MFKDFFSKILWGKRQELRDRIIALEKEKNDIEARYRLLSTSSAEFIWTLDRNLVFTYVSPSVRLILNYQPEELNSKYFQNIVTPLSYQLALKIFNRIIEVQTIEDLTDLIFISEIEFLRKDGSKIWTEIVSNPLLDERGNVFGIRGSARDISERKKGEHVIHSFYTMLQTIFDSLDVMVYVADISTHEILFINKQTRELFGDVIGKTCYKALHQGLSEPCNFCTNKRLVDKDGKPTRVYVREFRNPINSRWYETHDLAIEWYDGRIVRLEIANDITSRKRDELRLFKYLKQQELYSKVSYLFNTTANFSNNVNMILAMLGKEAEVSRVVIFENFEPLQTSTNVYEWCNQGIRSKINDFQKFSPEQFKVVEDIINEKGHIKIKDISDELAPVLAEPLAASKVISILIFPIYVKNRFFGFIGFEDCISQRKWTVLDIELIKTVAGILSNAYERKIIEEAIRESEQKLREANAAKDKMFSIIGHDLRGPMGNIKSMLEMLVEDPDLLDDQMLKLLKDSAGATFNLLENLLYWAKSQRGQIEPSACNLELKALIVSNIELLLGHAESKKIRIYSSIQNEIFVYADENMLTTVIRNLIQNAIKFTPSGGTIKISAKIDKGISEITVSDTGVGIAKENIEKVFNRSEHYTTYGTNNEKGSGLGLLLCKEFVETNGGKIWIESEPDKGSSFIFTVPLSKQR